MMRLLRNIAYVFRKVFTNYGFYGCVCMTCIISLLSYGYERDTVIQIAFKLSKEEKLLNCSLNALTMLSNGSGVWLSMFIPIIAGFTFVPLFCDEHEHRNLRNALVRSSKNSFFFARYAGACISGGIAVVCGYLLYAAIVYRMFPAVTDYTPLYQEEILSLLESAMGRWSTADYGMLLLYKTIEVFLLGAAATVPALLLSSMMRNKYLILCIPFLLWYMITQLCQKLAYRAYEDWEHPNVLLGAISDILNPRSLLSLFNGFGDKTAVLIYNGVLLFGGLLLYMRIQNRRLDCGE